MQAPFPLANLYLVKLIVDSLAVERAKDFQPVLQYVLMFDGIQLFLAIIKNYEQLVSETPQQLVTDYMATIIIDKAIDVDLSFYENPQYFPSSPEASYVSTCTDFKELNINIFFRKLKEKPAILALKIIKKLLDSVIFSSNYIVSLNEKLTLMTKINTKKLTKDIQFRPIKLKDMPFLQTVYACTRTDVQNNDTLTTAQKEVFIHHQFNAQHSHYQTHYKGANFDIILLKKQPIGRLYIHRQAAEIRLIDIALLPKYQNNSIGTFLMKNLLEEGENNNKIVSLHVEKTNPALKLYERLGFKKKAEAGIRFLMEWKRE